MWRLSVLWGRVRAGSSTRPATATDTTSTDVDHGGLRTRCRIRVGDVREAYLPTRDHPSLFVVSFDQPQLLRPAAVNRRCRGCESDTGRGLPQEVGVVVDSDDHAPIAEPALRRDTGGGLVDRAVHAPVHDPPWLEVPLVDGPRDDNAIAVDTLVLEPEFLAESAIQHLCVDSHDPPRSVWQSDHMRAGHPGRMTGAT